MEEIKVMSRKEAIKASYKLPKDKKYAIISISEISDSSPSFHNSSSLINVLKLHFDDVDEAEYGCLPINEKDAKEIARFVMFFADKVDCLIVHCLAGISRSSGCAAAISKWYFGDDSEFFDESKYTPNMTVYRTVLNALVELGGLNKIK